MIFPRSFPNTSTSFDEEVTYKNLSELPSERFACFYQVDIGENGSWYYADFVVVDKNRGVCVLEVENVSWQQTALYTPISTFEKTLRQIANAAIAVELRTTYASDDSIRLYNLISKEKAKEMSDETFYKLVDYLKTKSLYFAPSEKINHISLSNFRGIRQANLENLSSENNWIFVTGENGYGKTSFLQAVALGLYSPDQQFLIHEVNGSGSTSISNSSPPSKVKIQLQTASNEQYDYSYPNTGNKQFRYICAYGASRLTVWAEGSYIKEQTAISSLFDATAHLKNIEYDLYDWFINERDPIAQEKFHHTKVLLERLLDGTQIDVSTTSKKIWYKEQHEGQIYPPVTLNELAAGYKSLLAMVGDMILRLLEVQPDVVNPAELTGIVIIDELDIHWHPKWQMKLPSLFTELFPNIQFIASTHSPIPLLGAPQPAVFLKVDRTVEGGIVVERFTKLEREIKQLTPNNLLTSDIFDFDFFENLPEHQVDQLHTEDNYNDIEKNKEIEEQLKQIDEDSLPDDLFSKAND